MHMLAEIAPATTTIRSATSADIPRLVEMGGRFIELTIYRDRVAHRPDALRALATKLTTAGDEAAILVAEHGDTLIGMIGLVMFEHHISGELVAGEVCWWVEPEARGSAGVRLLKAAERWARDRHAVALQMIAPTEDVACIYQALGYTPVETTYQRNL